MISGTNRVLDLHAQGGGVEHHDGVPAVQNFTKRVALFIILKFFDFLASFLRNVMTCKQPLCMDASWIKNKTMNTF
jgi:hypothetical protein